MNLNNTIPLIAACIALLSVISVASFAWLNYQRERLNQRIQHANLRQQYFAGLRVWAEQISDLLSQAIHLCELDPPRCRPITFFERRNNLRVPLSSFIDRGRWFFPNLHTEEYGQHKEKAFRGYRQDVLNSLVSAYKVIGELDYTEFKNNRALKDKIVDAKKKFVSEIQDILNPNQRDKEFSDITERILGKK
jgi:hypothetical protein